MGKTYAYSIRVKDECGNASEISDEVEAMVVPDKEAPIVEGITPDAGKVNKNARIRIQASDNKAVKEIILKYKEEASEEWIELATVDYDSSKAEYLWDTTQLEDGAYHIGAWAVDTSGNVSTEEFTRRYEVDNTGISKVEILKATSGSSYIQLHFADVTEEDFAYFQIEMYEDGIYKVMGKESTKLGFVVNSLKSDTEYSFKVAGYDKLGNRGEESDVYTATTLSDTIAPTITSVLPISSYYNNRIDLSMKVTDNASVAYGVFSYSLDKENFIEIAKVEVSDDRSEATITHTYDITEFEEGSIYIRFEAFDKAGNKNVFTTDNEDIIVEYVIDRTAPEKVQDLTVAGGGGYASLNWKQGSEDIKYYKIYRAEEGSSDYLLLNGNVTTLNYYDTNVLNQTSYSYKIKAVDIAGNEGELSDAVTITIEEDKENPKIISMSPYDGDRIKDNATIKVLASDNAALSQVSLKYRKLSENNSSFKELDSKAINTKDGLLEFSFNTSGLDEGDYVIRAEATDLNGNVSTPFDVNYMLDKTAPNKASVSVTNTDYMVELSMGKSEAEDFSHYELLRKGQNGEYTVIAGNITEEGYTDTTVDTREFYDYKVRAYDECGNYSESEETSVYVTDNDTIAPVAVIPENLIGIAGLEIALDAGLSSDNHRIKTYEWNMGNGDIVTGRQTVYVYDEPGVYTISLKVTDENGNEDTTTATVHIYDDTENGLSYVKVTDTNGNPIPYASIYVRSSNDEIMNLSSDENGLVTIAGKYGTYTVAAMKDGYLPADISISLSKYEKPEYALTLRKGEVVTGNLTVNRMTMQELVEAGVDLTDPDNYNTVSFTVQLVFQEKPIPIETTIVEGTTTKIEATTPGGSQGTPDEEENVGGGTITVDKVYSESEEPIYVYMSNTQSISWLKDMYNVNLGILNQADTKYVLEDSKAVLNLPDGVSLAKTTEGQSLTVDLGDIEGQTEANASWVVKGDKRGTYTLTADYTGTLQPFGKEIHKTFKSESEFTVTSGEDVHLYIYPESTAYDGEMYYIQYEIVNQSDKTLYNISTSIGPYIIPTGKSKVEVTDEEGNTQTVIRESSQSFVIGSVERFSVAPVLNSGDIVYMPVLYPGQTFRGTFATEFAGKEGDEEDWKNTDTYYQLVKYYADKTTDMTTGVMCHVIPVEGHISTSRSEYLEIPDLYADPVDTSTGAFTEEIELLKVTGGTSLALNLSYNSLNADIKGSTGYGWTHNYSSYIEEASGQIQMYVSDGAAATFVKEEALEGVAYGTVADGKIIISADEAHTYGTYKCVSGGMQGYTLVKNENGYKVTAENQDEYTFSNEGKLTGIKDREGKSISLTHTDRQSVVTDDISGREIIIGYNDAGMVTSVTGAGRMATLSYTEDSLSTITDENGKRRTFTYDNNHYLTSGTDGNDSEYVVNEYDEKGRVIKQTNAEKGVTTFNYEEKDGITTVTITDPNGNEQSLKVDYSGNVINVLNANGSETSYSYDESGRLIDQVDDNGNKVHNEYDDEGNLICITDTAGIKTHMSYDERGNVVKVESEKAYTGEVASVDTAGNSSSETANVSTAGNSSSGTDERKTVASYAYDESNHIIRTIEAGGKDTTYTYDENGYLQKQSVAGIGETSFVYEKGQLIKTTDPLGNVTTYTYDESGNLQSKTNAYGDKVTYSYDSRGNLLSQTDEKGETTSYTYDGNGNLLSVTDPMGNKTSYAYDGNGNKISEVYADGSNAKYYYDANGNTTAITHNDGRTYGYAYDEVGNCIQETYPDGTGIVYEYNKLNQRVSEAKNGEDAITYIYYPNGNLYKETYPTGESTLYTYDERWRKVRITDALGNSTSYTYDEAGNVATVTDALGNTTVYSYDVLGNVLSVTDALGNKTTYTYDANGNCLTSTNAEGVTTNFVYDKLNRMTETYTITEGRKIGISYEYDEVGRVIKATDQMGYDIHYSYDKNGNLLSIIDQMGVEVESYTYNEVNAVATSVNALGNETTYTYNAYGELVKTVEKLNEEKSRTYTYAYDKNGELTKTTQVTSQGDITTENIKDNKERTEKIIDANGGTTTYTYDALNRVISEVNAIGSSKSYTYNAVGLLAESKNVRNQTTTYTYDEIGRITEKVDKLGTTTYTYDKNSNVLTVTDEQGTITRTYDNLNRIKTQTDHNGRTIGYAYDELGNLISLTYPGGEIVRYEYYDNGNVKNVTDPKGRVTSYEYDPCGRLIKTTRANKTVEARTYDKAGLLLSIKEEGTAEIINDYEFTYDESGNITKISGTGNKSAITQNINCTMEYDAANRLICYNGEELTYDADGNMLKGVVEGEVKTLKYDCRNRLTQAGNDSYEYNAENTRVATKTETKTTEYVTDVSGTLSRVLAEYVTDNETGEITYTIYVYGQGLISQENIVDDETTYDYYTYHYNHLGSTTAITDEAGNVVERYTYGTYGELLSGTTDKVHYLYNGQYGVSTEDNGLYYMRQRYYNPEIKRFINQDIITGSIGNSQSLNRYCYVQGNPVSMTDPFGLFPLVNFGSNIAHAILNVIGMAPGAIGTVADLLNAGLYALEGDTAGAITSLVSSIPYLGNVAAARLAVKGGKWVDTARLVSWTSNLIGNGATFLRSGGEFLSGISGLIQDYRETGKINLNDVGATFLNGAAALISGKSVLTSANAIRKLASESKVASKIKNSLGNAVSKVKSKFTRGASNQSTRIDYSNKFDTELRNFNDGYEIREVVESDMILVQYSSDEPDASLCYWTTVDEANEIMTVDEYMNKLAISKGWGNRNTVKVARIPAGTEVKYAVGTAREQLLIPDPRPGGGLQYLFSEFDTDWITEVRELPN